MKHIGHSVKHRYNIFVEIFPKLRAYRILQIIGKINTIIMDGLVHVCWEGVNRNIKWGGGEKKELREGILRDRAYLKCSMESLYSIYNPKIYSYMNI